MAADAERAAGKGGAVAAVGGDEGLEDPGFAAGLSGRGRRGETFEVCAFGSGCPPGFSRGHLAPSDRGECCVGGAKAPLLSGRVRGQGVGHVQLPGEVRCHLLQAYGRHAV